MKYVLYYHTGSGNHGCEAIVRATAKILGIKPTLFSTAMEEDKKYELDQISNLCDDTRRALVRKSPEFFSSAVQEKLTGKTTLNTKYTREKLLSAVDKGDICLSIGGDNYCYAGIEVLADLNKLICKRKAKTVLWGCSIDPEVITPMVADDLSRYDLITVREPITKEALRRAGIVQNVREVADPAFLLDSQETAIPDGFLEGNTIGINLSPLILNYTDNGEAALNSFYALVEEILHQTDCKVMLIPHVVKPQNNDLDILTPIYEKFRETKRVILVDDHNCKQLKYLISKCRLFIGARTHATIAAYSTFVPTLVIGYSVKSRGIARDLFGTEEHYVLPVQNIRSSDDLIHEFQWLMEHETEIRQHLTNIMPDYQKKALKAKEYIEELIK